ncbi:hypothetical protein HPB50_009635 [Hyalomma asiaticum]|uniref:Uncharacterized protein n=1 Tax=Hyalomma asiaticum TaxID=266040 RepID=A0ACB7T8Z9_HYAAI|nr:hypothetical protein HPB50_009635 [Hyalomma asiaticum]
MGCEFIGTMEELLRHFENNCSFHAKMCPECDRETLHTDLAAHRRACCGKGVPVACREFPDGDVCDATSKTFRLAEECVSALENNISEDNVACRTQAAAAQGRNGALKCNGTITGGTSEDSSLAAEPTWTSPCSSATQISDASYELWELAQPNVNKLESKISKVNALRDVQASSQATKVTQDSKGMVTASTSEESTLPARRSSTSKQWTVSQKTENTFTIKISQDSVLAAIQTEMDELRKQLSCQQAMLANFTHEQRASGQALREDVKEITATFSSRLSEQFCPRKSADNDATSSRRIASWEEELILRKLEHFANSTLNTLEQLRQNMPERVRRHVIARCDPVRLSRDRFMLSRDPPTLDKPFKGPENATYILRLENATEIFLCQEEYHAFAEATVWHTRDTYFIVVICRSIINGSPVLVIETEFNALLASLERLPRINFVKAFDRNECRIVLSESDDMQCTCKRTLEVLCHFHQRFFNDLSALRNGILLSGSMVFEIEVVEPFDTP